jgi:taurine dioxygenase
MTEERFIYRHRWRSHDLVMWDNRATVHLATGCPPEFARTLYRTTVRGDAPIGPRRSVEALATVASARSLAPPLTLAQRCL